MINEKLVFVMVGMMMAILVVASPMQSVVAQPSSYRTSLDTNDKLHFVASEDSDDADPDNLDDPLDRKGPPRPDELVDPFDPPSDDNTDPWDRPSDDNTDPWDRPSEGDCDYPC